MITSTQCLEARRLLGWSRDRLAPRCDFSTETLRRFEGGAYRLAADQLEGLKEAFEAAGVKFINGGDSGVRLRRNPG